MIKKEPSQKTTQKFYSLSPRHIEYIEHFMKERGMLSASDVVRQAIAFFHDKTFPDYVYRETAAGEAKRAKQEEHEAFTAMSEEDYCRDILKAPIYDSVSGFQFALLHTIGNSLNAYQVIGIKEFMAQNPAIIETHLDILKRKTIPEALSVNMKRLLKYEYEIIFPDDDKQESKELNEGQPN